MVSCFLLPQTLRLSFVTNPTKRGLPLRFIGHLKPSTAVD